MKVKLLNRMSKRTLAMQTNSANTGEKEKVFMASTCWLEKANRRFVESMKVHWTEFGLRQVIVAADAVSLLIR
jgi:hypothetical protein